MTLCEFLAEHPNLRVSIWSSNNYYYVDVLSNVFHNGILPFCHFSFSKSLLESAVSSFDTIIGTHLENWYRSLTNNDIERIDGKSVKEIPYEVSIADETRKTVEDILNKIERYLNKQDEQRDSDEWGS